MLYKLFSSIYGSILEEDSSLDSSLVEVGSLLVGSLLLGSIGVILLFLITLTMCKTRYKVRNIAMINPAIKIYRYPIISFS